MAKAKNKKTNQYSMNVGEEFLNSIYPKEEDSPTTYNSDINNELIHAGIWEGEPGRIVAGQIILFGEHVD